MEPQPKNQIILNDQSELADFLDSNCNAWRLSWLNSSLIDKLKSAKFPNELSGFIGLEQLALGIWFEGCKAKRGFSAIKNSGEEVGTPLPSELQPAALDYFVQRFEQTTNLYLKARYGLILWNAPKGHKHKKYIDAAFDNLLKALTKADCFDHNGLSDCIAVLRQICAIAADVKYQSEDAVSAVLDRFKNIIPFEREGRNQLFRLITDFPKLFRSEATGILDSARILFEESFTAEDFSACWQLSHRAAPFAQGSGSDVQEWHHRNGRANEGLAQECLSDYSTLASMQRYTSAALAYQLAGDEAAKQKVLQKAQDLKSGLRLASTTINISDNLSQMINDDIKQGKERLLNLDNASIFAFIAGSNEVIPDYDFVRREAEKADFSISDIASIVSIDINKNFQQSGPGNATDGNIEHKIRESYGFLLNIRLQYLIPLFVNGCRNGKLTFPALRDYLDQNSWIAYKLTDTDLDGTTTEFTLQRMLYPAFDEFFKQLQLFVQQDPTYLPSFVLCLESLTLKVEGLLRVLLQLKGGATVAAHKGNLTEVYFDELVGMAHQSDLLTQSEAYFLRYVFTPEGNNLRNNIAHSYYYLPEHYSLQSMILVFCAVLRLTGFGLTSQP